MRHLETWFGGGFDTAGLTVGLENLLQPKRFHVQQSLSGNSGSTALHRSNLGAKGSCKLPSLLPPQLNIIECETLGPCSCKKVDLRWKVGGEACTTHCRAPLSAPVQYCALGDRNCSNVLTEHTDSSGMFLF